jgi:hypothetical protein
MVKKIVAFADGTGNAYFTQESNVWRLYQALDQSQPDQIARYIKGVGTSGFSPFAYLDGATGIGVPSNVRELYRFICWNWRPDDEIYLFGFSRGSFTIRTLIGLIDNQGLLPTEIDEEPVSHAEMQRNSLAAWRAYRSESIPWNRSLPTIWITRLLRDACIALYHFILGHRSYKSVRQATKAQGRLNVRIKFSGLFDTVEAFGVPIEEFRTAIDWAIWPISFRNNRLCAAVDRARHALSLDDERTTFHPLRFDMTRETTDRVKEVWFAGVHSDVGGGYPDGALARVPLVWMAEEAEIAAVDASGHRVITGLRFMPGSVDAFREEASPYGPLHDSREGLAVIYRYDPRHIVVDDASGGPPVIHHSVAEKMVFGSENYAPITLPSSALVLMPDGTTEEIKGFSGGRAAMLNLHAAPVSAAVSAVKQLRDPDQNLVELTRDTIWWRRVAYFALLLAGAVAVSLPLTAEWITETFHRSVSWVADWVGLKDRWETLWAWLSNAEDGVGTNLHSISKTVGGLAPGYVKAWIDVIVEWPFTSTVVLLIVFLLYRLNGQLRDLIADRARRAWFAKARQAAAKKKGRKARPAGKAGLVWAFARCMRKSRLVAAGRVVTTRIILPGIGLAAILAVVLVTVSRTTVSYRAGRGDFCKPNATNTGNLIHLLPGVPVVRDGFKIDNLCWASGVAVEKGRSYLIWIDMVQPFFDQTIMTDIAGFRDSSPGGLFRAPVRRWWTADWFAPIARVGAGGDDEWPLKAVDGTAPLEIGYDASGKAVPARFYENDAYKARLAELQRGEAKMDPSRLPTCDKIPDAELPTAQGIRNKQNLRTAFVSEFVAPADGELFVYVNDAIGAVPFGPTIKCFYANNSGTAKVRIQRVQPPSPAPSAASPQSQTGG